MNEYTYKPGTLVLLKSVEVAGEILDVLFAHAILAMGNIPARQGMHVVSGDGGALLPSLTDHHIHLRGLAAANQSVYVGPDAVANQEALLALLAAQPGDGWLRCVGYHESTLGELTAHELDAVSRPLRVQHRSGKVWVLNTAAMQAVGLLDSDQLGVERDNAGYPTGRLFRMDQWLAERISSMPLDLAAVGTLLNSYGITHVTDASHTNTAEDERALSAALPSLVVQCLGGEGLKTPRKVMLDEDDLPDLDALTSLIQGTHQANRGVAFHCVSRTELVFALAGLDAAGHHTDDRIEHGAIVPAELFAQISKQKIPVVTQPGFIFERGEQYLTDVESAELENLYRYRSLLEAGITVISSSDAPYGPVSPWRAMATAVARCTDRGSGVGTAEGVSAEEVLAGYLKRSVTAAPTQLQVGGPADLCLLDRKWAQARRDLVQVKVTATWLGGKSVWPG